MKRLYNQQGVRNLRDSGGYACQDGSKMKWGLLYRSAVLNEEHPDIVRSTLTQLGINTVIDLRNTSEIDAEPVPEIIKSHYRHISIPILVKGTSRTELVEALLNSDGSSDFSHLLTKVNERLVLEHHEDIQQYITALLNHEGPSLTHCSEGKDRTGFCIALVQSLLGVSTEDILSDYLLTNECNAQSIDSRLERICGEDMAYRETIRPLFCADINYLNAAFATIKEEYGKIENYLISGLAYKHSDLADLKNKLTEV